jgi:hypothetical protein
VAARQLLERFSLPKLAREKIVMTLADDAWLRAAARPLSPLRGEVGGVG